MASYQLYVRDANRSLVAQVSAFTNLQLTLRYNAPGRWMLTLPWADAAAAHLAVGSGGLMVVRAGAVLLSGPVEWTERTWNADGDMLVAAGPDDTGLLATRLALPDSAGPPYTTFEHDVRTGAAETIMREYVAYNAGASARVERQIAGLTLDVDHAAGATITGRARFVNLLTLLQQLGLAGGLGFRVVQENTDLEFQVYETRDLTATIIFAGALGNLEQFEKRVTAPEGNYIVCAGGGEGTARTFAERGNPASITAYGRYEVFRDRRDTTDVTELEQTIDEELEARAASTEMHVQPVDTVNMAFGTDYGLGDRVTVVVDGVPIQDIIRELRVLLNEDGETVTPVITDAGYRGAAILPMVSELQRRISSLERV